jgi:plasmid maintenance system antidote protein VapI
MRQIKEVYRMLDERTVEDRPVWNVAAIARHFDVSRPTIYKLIGERADLAAHIGRNLAPAPGRRHSPA